MNEKHQKRISMLAHVTALYANGELLVDVVWQKRPITVVRVQVPGYSETGENFSKVNWPDEWDEEEGVGVATRKALYDLACALVDTDTVVPQ